MCDHTLCTCTLITLTCVSLLQVRAMNGAGSGDWTQPALVCPGKIGRGAGHPECQCVFCPHHINPPLPPPLPSGRGERVVPLSPSFSPLFVLYLYTTLLGSYCSYYYSWSISYRAITGHYLGRVDTLLSEEERIYNYMSVGLPIGLPIKVVN